MGADFELSINQNGQPSLLYIDKGNNKVNVGTKLSDFDIEKKLGQGHFGSVCLVKSKKTNKLYALKEIRGEIFNDNQRKEVEKFVFNQKAFMKKNTANLINFNNYKEKRKTTLLKIPQVSQVKNGFSLEEIK